MIEMRNKKEILEQLKHTQKIGGLLNVLIRGPMEINTMKALLYFGGSSREGW